MTGEVNPQPDTKDVTDNKLMAVFAYIIFFIPLIAARESKFAMYHANQGLLVFLAAVIINIVGSIIPLIGWFLIIPLGNLAVLAYVIIGIINAVNGVQKPLPLIGKIEIIK